MSEQPVIGICAVRERARWAFWDQTAHLVADTYVAALQETKAVAVLLPVDTRAPDVLLDRIDGLVVIGGADIDPRFYGQKPSEALEKSYAERDEFEIALTLGAIERGLPFLGICRGMQLLNVARGGTLLQELTNENGVPTHRRIVGTFEGNEHQIELDPGSLAERAIGESIHVGRCHHHQAIDRLGEGLRVTGRAREDDVPEAIESSNGGWVLGVQWHPEAADKRELFHAFAGAARDLAAAQASAR
jgi:putative glutamine amidotransferase